MPDVALKARPTLSCVFPPTQHILRLDQLRRRRAADPAERVDDKEDNEDVREDPCSALPGTDEKPVQRKKHEERGDARDRAYDEREKDGVIAVRNKPAADGLELFGGEKEYTNEDNDKNDSGGDDEREKEAKRIFPPFGHHILEQRKEEKERTDGKDVDDEVRLQECRCDVLPRDVNEKYKDEEESRSSERDGPGPRWSVLHLHPKLADVEIDPPGLFSLRVLLL